ncbi:MAG TPA: PP2C family protein-serine/threonine phosphatase [Thermoanaerobaculia bacterium]|nr:PP2C family protein-serine/threonine phosphatase [Thermoanaerobaculia bacterium]
MKKVLPYLACALGIVVLVLLIPRFNDAQPHGIRLTRADAVPIADAEARQLGIPVDRAWTVLSWANSSLLDKELDPKPDLRRHAAGDPVIGPRLGGYKRVYYRRGLEKTSPYGYVVVDQRTGAVLMARRQPRAEETGAHLTEAQLRPRAEAFVHSREFPGAPSPQFEDARPSVMRPRTDWTFRYRVKTSFPIGNVVPYLHVYFVGDRLSGWALIEEYADGSQFRGDDAASGVASILVRFAANYALLLILLVIFLRKYHAGEVGVGTGSILFGLTLLIALSIDFMMGPSATEGNTMGSLDAQSTTAAQMAFKFLLYDVPLAVVVFFAWSVGESYTRERWGEWLASFDAILRRDSFNATVGRSVFNGVLFAPAIAAASFAAGVIPLLLHKAHPSIGVGTEVYVRLGGPLLLILFGAFDAVIFPIISLFLMSWTNRHRALWIGMIAAIAVGVISGVCNVPIDPLLPQMLFGFGAIAAIVLMLRGFDLLSTSVALFGGTVLSMTVPLMSVARGHILEQLILTTALPLAALFVFGIAAMLTKREVIYTYEDLAPHVKRIVERERVKAEIDAANRIQAALLPVDAPEMPGASFASHYRAATEIGGDYFDFLTLPSGEIGIAFGDVSGHGLTSGIVMAMAKSALLVQVGYDAGPRAVMNVLNDIVMKTAPKRILMTFFFGLLDPVSQTLRFSSAGHLDPYVYRAGSRRLEALSSWGFPLGVRRREPFTEHSVDFDAGDRLILYSDGLIEAIDDDGDPFGFERFEKTILSCGHMHAEDIKKTLLNSIRKFTRNRPPEDDQTLVVVSFEEEATARVAI